MNFSIAFWSAFKSSKLTPVRTLRLKSQSIRRCYLKFCKDYVARFLTVDYPATSGAVLKTIHPVLAEPISPFVDGGNVEAKLLGNMVDSVISHTGKNDVSTLNLSLLAGSTSYNWPSPSSA